MPRSAEQSSRRAAKERERRAAESLASLQARLNPTRLQLGIGVLWKHLRLVKLGWIPTRLQLGDAVRRKPWSPASPPSVGTLVCALSFVVRLQMLLRLGVRAVAPLIATLLSTFYGFTHVPALLES